MTNTNYDIAVIGGGPAGYIAAIRAARGGASTCLIEADSKLGGTCLRRGCIPTKFYLEVARTLDSIAGKDTKRRGISINRSAVEFDLAKSLKEKNRTIDRLSGGITTLLDDAGVTKLSGFARVTPDRKIIIKGEAESQEIAARHIIVAGGSTPTRLPIDGLDLCDMITSDEILDLTEVPKRLTIIGGGVIGIEMARIFLAFGSEVTIVELADRLAPFLDHDLDRPLLDSLRRRAEIHTGRSVAAGKRNEVEIVLSLDDDTQISTDCVLVAVGRSPQTDALAELDVERDPRGFIEVDDYMQTSIEGIYAPGDINGRSMLAHTAMKMGELAADHAIGHPAKPINFRRVPGAIYGRPEVGYIGLTEKEAREQYGDAVRVGRFPFQASGRAVASGEPAGLVKIVTESRLGEILGVHILGPEATELIGPIAALMEAEATVDELIRATFAHPTCSEAIMEAAADCHDECLHLPGK